MQQQNNIPIEEKIQDEQGETITELARRHAQDPTHETTDEEIKNARIELTNIDENDEEENLHAVDDSTIFPPIPGEPKIEDKNGSDDTSKPPNPYDVLNG